MFSLEAITSSPNARMFLLALKSRLFSRTCSLTKNLKNYYSQINKKDNLKKPKYSVLKRSFPVTGGSHVLEQKKASDVMKRLNWEFSQQFGPIRNTKPPKSVKNISASNEFIQHHSQIPVLDPLEINSLPDSVAHDSKIYSEEKEFDLSITLECPLMNKSDGKLQLKTSKLNYLRTYLDFLKGGSSIPSISTILEKTMPKERKDILECWKQNMIKELGIEGFEEYHRELLKSGTTLHSSISSYLASVPEAELHIEEKNRGHWRSLKGIFPHITDIKLLEENIAHPFLCYKGIVDCLAKYRGNLVVIDWKTSKKQKLSIENTFDNPLQIAAYVGALNFDPKFQYLVNKGLIVVAYENGLPATAHFIDEFLMLRYWNQWLKRVKLYWESVESSKS